jgi:hypothetical protein
MISHDVTLDKRHSSVLRAMRPVIVSAFEATTFLQIARVVMRVLVHPPRWISMSIRGEARITTAIIDRFPRTSRAIRPPFFSFNWHVE